MPTNPPHLSLFEGFGIEIEYMIVDRRSLAVRPIADEVIKAAAGAYVNEVERGAIAWSNELALHLLELKTNGPVPSLAGLAEKFHRELEAINALLGNFDAMLMPTAMHPWMDPDHESGLWPHDLNEIYAAYHRIFNCRGHGWTNLQSMHINLPFADASEFAVLHAAIRAALPILPALAASSPLVDGHFSGLMDTRLHTYQGNAAHIPCITGRVIPEAVTDPDDYQRRILEPMYRAIRPFDPDGILQFEWLNSRGAIARFDRYAIEIRVLDTQEAPSADLAIAATIICLVRALSEHKWLPTERLNRISTDRLAAIFETTVHHAENAVIEDRQFLQAFGFPGRKCDARDFWWHVAEEAIFPAMEPLFPSEFRDTLTSILRHGSLARRIQRAVGADAKFSTINAVYAELCLCLAENRIFLGLD